MTMIRVRTTNWSRFNRYSKTRPVKNEQHCRKAEIVKKILRRYTNDIRRDMVIPKTWPRKKISNKIHLLTHRFSLGQLLMALSTNNKKAIKLAIDRRINIKGDSICREKN